MITEFEAIDLLRRAESAAWLRELNDGNCH